MAKKSGECFLCQEEDKGRPFTFYSGVCKGGSTTRLMSATVTVFERWRDLRIYEIFVCRPCQLRLWAQETKWPPILCGGAAGLLSMMAGLCAVVLPFPVGLVVAGLVGLLVLAAAGAAVWYLLRHLARKPERERLEILVVKAAMQDLGEPGHTFITVDQYTELIRLGIVDT